MGEEPTWHRVLVAAKYLGVAPWVLERQPYRYTLQAEAAMTAEATAQANRERIRRGGR